MENEVNEKNIKLNKDMNNPEDITFKIKIFTFFYYVLRKKNINIVLCCTLLLLETLQLISYAYTTPHMSTWKIKYDTINYIQLIIGAPRITPLMTYLKFDYYIILYAILLGYIFIHTLLITMIIKFNKTNTKFYQIGVAITHYFTSPLTIFLMIPIFELILIPFKCEGGKIAIVKDSIDCWSGLHYMYCVLSIIFGIVFLCFIFLNSIFYFDPFNNTKSTTKIDTTADTFLYFCKMVTVIKFIFISNEYISIVIMVVLAMFNLKKGYENQTYNNRFLEFFLSIRNAAFFWTYIVLFIGKLVENSKMNGIIYLLLFGYPLIVTISIIYYRKESQNFKITSANFNDVNEYLTRIKYMIKLIESYLNKNKNGKSNKGNICKKNEILLKGIIAIHEQSCVVEDCPLKKFEENMNNFSIQKTCLLHYMNNLFTEGIKKFPNSRLIIMIFVQFNYDKKYNLNAAKTYLTKLEKQKNTLTENYIIYSLRENIASNNNKMNMRLGENEEMLKVEDTIEEKYRRLKFLVETTTKLYGEFWGILATNLTNNLNLNKLFSIGNKLNKFLNELNNLWENDLKNKKIDLENQSIAQLYSYFLREILKNKKRSEEITKKLNEEQHYESRKTESDNFNIDNLDIILENQDYVFYSRTNEKGECDIIQLSNSVVHLLGYTKQELIGRNIETIMPGVFANAHAKMLSNRIKGFRSIINKHKDNFRASDKKQIFILPKTKVGYLIPIKCRFTIYNDDDFSNTYIIKAKFEAKDSKSVYAFYILTKDDFSVDSISSSSINLGLSMDLLKKYVINMNVLVRSQNDFDTLEFSESYNDYEEEAKKVTWVFPDKIYPKNDNQRNKEENVNELIRNSNKKEYMLLISRMKYNDEDTLGFCFRFTEIDNKKSSVDPGEFKPNSTQHILFDLLRLNYIRTLLVKKKSHNYHDFHPMIHRTSLIISETKQNQNKKEGKTKRKKDKKKETEGEVDSDEEEEDDKKLENLLTKEKILELQGKNSDDIKNFILGLPFFGNEVSLERYRPNKEKYPVGKAQEPEIKITIYSFIKRIEDKIKNHPDRRQEGKMDFISKISPNASSTIVTGITSEFATDSSAALGNIFNEKSVRYIQFFSLVTFLCIAGIISVEFGISLSSIKDSSQRMGYMDKGFIILNSLVYTKFFLTEAVLGNLAFSNAQGSEDALSKEPYLNLTTKADIEAYVKDMMAEMAKCRETIANMYSHYSNATVSFSKEYKKYISNTQVRIKTLSNGIETEEFQPFSSAMNRIPTSIFYVSTVTDHYSQINIYDRNAYELMMNLLNDYFLIWRDVTFLLVEDVKEHTVRNNTLVVIFALSFLVSIVALFILWKLITRFIDDREKPVDLFLTIKKKKFEELKTASENFINKLLNKFFGNEENEEESMVDYSTNIQPDDINIIKFKQKNDYNQSLRTSSEYLLNYFKIVIFFIVLLGYLTFKFCYNNKALSNMNQYTDVFNITHYSHSDIILSLDVVKSFFYNHSIPIFNNTKKSTEGVKEITTKETFSYNFIDISNTFEYLLIISYNTTCFLSGSYISHFYDWMNNDITHIVTQEYLDEDTFLGTLKNGFKSTISRYFELIRFIGISYFQGKETHRILNDNSPGGEYRVYLKWEEFKEISKYIYI